MDNAELIKTLKERLSKVDNKVEAITLEESNARTQQLQKESEGVTKLSILIATTKDRRWMFNVLMQEFNRQIEMCGFKGKGKETWFVKLPRMENGEQVNSPEGLPIFDVYQQYFKHPDIVAIEFEEDNKEISVGAKRQKLLEKSKGKYIVYFDSDDFPKQDYVKEIMQALEDGPDCVGFRIAMTTNGKKPETCIHSLSNPEWTFKGGIYLRNCTHFNPILRSIAIQVGFEDRRFGEDKIYSDKVSKLCKKETFIDKYLFDYRYSSQEPHEIKYGFKK